MTTTDATVDYEAVKTRQQATWSSGDYRVIGSTLQLVGESLCESLDHDAGERVLDVAAGNGNASLAAARRGALVTATDYVGALLEGTAARAAAERLDISTREADAEALPFGDGQWDVALSTFGVMFAPNQEQCAAELLRVVRHGGRIGLASWTPSGFVGQMLRLVGVHVPPPPGLRSPLEWGTPERLSELFPGAHVEATTRQFVFRYRSAQAWVDTFRAYYGPTHQAFAALDEPHRVSCEQDLIALADTHNTSTTGTLRVPSEYLETIIRKD
jgi:ubiquinone/menaquinone biosynthesis C-methylase UbiE